LGAGRIRTTEYVAWQHRVGAQTIFFRKLVEGEIPTCGAYKIKNTLSSVFLILRLPGAIVWEVVALGFEKVACDFEE